LQSALKLNDLVAGKADLPRLAFRALPTVDKALGEVVEDGLSRHASGCALYRVGSIRPARRMLIFAVGIPQRWRKSQMFS
ncbi:hypothetical protein, partial [Mesorhizobium sp. M8A.F.Ca.ET.213.01.1.1]|uniref:hypothetical protein n=1 Tax=Mesorhizobium sp. M8A.F.Ca.ET.213.01.1.1 TaxID=2563970 RepID=UPI001AEDA834